MYADGTPLRKLIKSIDVIINANLISETDHFNFM